MAIGMAMLLVVLLADRVRQRLVRLRDELREVLVGCRVGIFIGVIA